MRAELTALVGVEATFKQCANDRDIDRAPVQTGSLAQFGDVDGAELRDVNRHEQVAVETGNVVHAVKATLAHGCKQLSQTLR